MGKGRRTRATYDRGGITYEVIVAVDGETEGDDPDVQIHLSGFLGRLVPGTDEVGELRLDDDGTVLRAYCDGARFVIAR